ncbi:MAG: hypothetical protein J3R72DRAFT_104313 [Linnemannia gamsii]|nr:MAG: hypothetical protein J3R72DRAFT_104313 [Linnemannia gamsii]
MIFFFFLCSRVVLLVLQVLFLLCFKLLVAVLQEQGACFVAFPDYRTGRPTKCKQQQVRPQRHNVVYAHGILFSLTGCYEGRMEATFLLFVPFVHS